MMSYSWIFLAKTLLKNTFFANLMIVIIKAELKIDLGDIITLRNATQFASQAKLAEFIGQKNPQTKHIQFVICAAGCQSFLCV